MFPNAMDAPKTSRGLNQISHAMPIPFKGLRPRDVAGYIKRGELIALTIAAEIVSCSMACKRPNPLSRM
jgi:hypothetical protein